MKKGFQVAAIATNPGAVLLGDGPAQLAAARCLAKQGVRVCVLGPARSMLRTSRAVGQFIVCPNGLPDEDLPAYLMAQAERHHLHGWVLFPGDDEHLRVLAQHHTQLTEYFILTTPPWTTIQYLYDKRLTHTLAMEAGVPIPQNWTIDTASPPGAQEIEYPVVLKPAITSHLLKVSTRKAYRANNPQEFQQYHAALTRLIPPAEVLVQELLPDPSRNLFSFAGYFQEGEPVAGLAVQRLRQYPRDFGWSSTLVVVREVPEIKILAARLLRPLRYTGLAEVEFMWNPKRMRFELLEVNARFWAWLGLAAAAGLDLTGVAFAQVLGRAPVIGPPRQGAKWIRTVGDLRAAAQDIRAGTLSFRQYLASLQGTTALAVFSPADPMPFLMEMIYVLRKRLAPWFSAWRPNQPAAPGANRR